MSLLPPETEAPEGTGTDICFPVRQTPEQMSVPEH